MKHFFSIGLLVLLTSSSTLFAQSDSVTISESLHIERSDARKWIERYQTDIDRYIDQNCNTDDDLSCDALFIGSSSINMWNTLHEDMLPMKVIRRSYGGSTIRDMLYNYDVIARGYDPACIVMYVENDFCSCKEGITEYETFDLFRIFVQRIQRDYPGIPFYIISFKPSLARWNEIEKHKVTNHLLKTYAENTPDVEFIDITQAMYDEDGKLRQDIFLSDNLHLNAKGYEIWTSIIKPAIIKHRKVKPYILRRGSKDYPFILKEDKTPLRISDEAFILDPPQMENTLDWIEYLPASFKQRQGIGWEELYKIEGNTLAERFFVLHSAIYTHNKEAKITQKDNGIEIIADELDFEKCYFIYIIQEDKPYKIFKIPDSPYYHQGQRILKRFNF